MIEDKRNAQMYNGICLQMFFIFYVLAAMKESKDLSTLNLTELMESLQVY